MMSSKIDDSQVIKTQPPARPTLTNFLSIRSQCCQKSPWMTAHFQTAHFGTSLSQNQTISGHWSWVVLCRHRCRLLLGEIPKGSDRNAEIKRGLQLWEAGDIHELVGRVLGQQRTSPLRRKKKVMHPQTDDDSQRIHQQSNERTRGRDSTGLSRVPEDQYGVCRGSACCLERRQVQGSERCNERARAQQNRYCVTASCQIGAHECTTAHGRTTATPGCRHLLRGRRAKKASVSRT